MSPWPRLVAYSLYSWRSWTASTWCMLMAGVVHLPRLCGAGGWTRPMAVLGQHFITWALPTGHFKILTKNSWVLLLLFCFYRGNLRLYILIFSSDGQEALHCVQVLFFVFVFGVFLPIFKVTLWLISISLNIFEQNIKFKEYLDRFHLSSK